MAGSGEMAQAGRKRQAEARVPAAQLEDMRLPAFTMFYRATPPRLLEGSCADSGDGKDACLEEGPAEFYFEDAAARESSVGEPCRVLQWKASSQLRLLRAADGCEAIPSLAELLAAAEARGMDGALVAERRVVLLRPADQVRLIDDDKRDGVKQELLTDMFMRMSLRWND